VIRRLGVILLDDRVAGASALHEGSVFE